MAETTRAAPKSRFMPGLLLGIGVSFLFMSLGAVTYVRVQRTNVRAGWNLVPIVVVTEDLPAGTLLTWDHISQRQLPEQFATESIFRPDDAHELVNKRLAMAVHSGDVLMRGALWHGGEQALTACLAQNVAPKEPGPKEPGPKEPTPTEPVPAP